MSLKKCLTFLVQSKQRERASWPGRKEKSKLGGCREGLRQPCCLGESIFHWEGQGPAPGLNLAPSLWCLSPQTQAVWGVGPSCSPFQMERCCLAVKFLKVKVKNSHVYFLLLFLKIYKRYRQVVNCFENCVQNVRFPLYLSKNIMYDFRLSSLCLQTQSVFFPQIALFFLYNLTIIKASIFLSVLCARYSCIYPYSLIQPNEVNYYCYYCSIIKTEA